MPEFQPGQHVRVRKEGGDRASRPDRRFMGKQGIIQHSTGRPEGGPPNFYVVEFHGATFRDNVFAISPDWLEEVVE